MGFESFRVELSGGTATRAEADEVVRRFPHAKPDPDSIDSRESTYFLVGDGRHVIEVEVAGEPPRVSCRFTLCHPPSVDAAFLELIRGLVTRLGMVACIPDHGPEMFPADRFTGFAEHSKRAIATRRAEWVKAFGPEQLAATTAEVHEKIILPRCTPVVG